MAAIDIHCHIVPEFCLSELIATLEDLSEGERAAMSGETAARLYNIAS